MAKLDKTRICLDCDEVFDENEHSMCPACASFATASLMLWVVPLEVVWGKELLGRPPMPSSEAGVASC